MPTVPRLLERRANRVEFSIRKNPDVASYEFQAANTLDTAFAGATAMFSVGEGLSYRSKTIRQRRWGLVDENNRPLTRVIYDPDDFAGGAIPTDPNISFVRVAETSAAGIVRPAGPIFVVPPPNYLTSSRPPLTVSGTAPNVGATTTGVPPAGAMHFVLPKYADNIRISNTGSQDLLISFGAGLPEFNVDNGTSEIIYDSHISEIFIRGNGATVAFNIHFALVNGLQE